MDEIRRSSSGRFVIGGRCPFIRSGPGALPSAAERSRVPRIVVQAAEENPPVLTMLASEGFELVACADGQALLEEVMHRQPDAVIYALGADCREDLGVLRLMRRAAPDVPLVLLACDGSLDTRRSLQSLRPIYFAVSPVDDAELRDVVRSAVRRRGRVV
jgi:DNA-binding response OmpR family regulator